MGAYLSLLAHMGVLWRAKGTEPSSSSTLYRNEEREHRQVVQVNELLTRLIPG